MNECGGLEFATGSRETSPTGPTPDSALVLSLAPRPSTARGAVAVLTTLYAAYMIYFRCYVGFRPEYPFSPGARVDVYDRQLAGDGKVLRRNFFSNIVSGPHWTYRVKFSDGTIDSCVDHYDLSAR